MQHTKLFVTILVCLALSACDDKLSMDASEPNHSAGQPAHEGAMEWHAPTTDVPRNELCMVDAINGETAVANQARVPAAGPLSLQGWVSTSELANPDTFQVVFRGDSSFQVEGRTGVRRDDVADAYGSQDLAESGFSIDLVSTPIPAGEYAMLLQHHGQAGVTLCDPGITLIVE